jgi:Fe2+ transport system protein FeoA
MPQKYSGKGVIWVTSSRFHGCYKHVIGPKANRNGPGADGRSELSSGPRDPVREVDGMLGLGVCNSDLFGRILNSDLNGRTLKVIPFRRPNGVRRVSVLSELNVGETAVVVALSLPDAVQNHLMHMGFVPDASVTALRRAPAGDPTVYAIDGMEIALRRETANSIHIRNAELDLEEEERELLEAGR